MLRGAEMVLEMRIVSTLTMNANFKLASVSIAVRGKQFTMTLPLISTLSSPSKKRTPALPDAGF